MNKKTKLNIKDWAIEDRPREKMLLKGVASLSNAELLAILIGSGNKEETAVELSQRILYSVSNNLNELGKLSIKDLMTFSGIGEAKAITIIAAMELGKRRRSEEAVDLQHICHSKDIFEIMHPLLADLPHEETWVLFLNHSNKVIKKYQASKGGITGSSIDVRIIIKEAIDVLATAMVLCHNHPSGDSDPSNTDDTITFKLRDAGRTMNIPLLDHLVICDRNYYSYRDESRL